MKRKDCVVIPKDFTGIWEDCDGVEDILFFGILHCKDGKYHREDGPAVEWANGSKEWWLNGTSHTEKEWKTRLIEINRRY
jgi:hypothetical protein